MNEQNNCTLKLFYDIVNAKLVINIRLTASHE